MLAGARDGPSGIRAQCRGVGKNCLTEATAPGASPTGAHVKTSTSCSTGFTGLSSV